jgi:hypothetical protein
VRSGSFTSPRLSRWLQVGLLGRAKFVLGSRGRTLGLDSPNWAESACHAAGANDKASGIADAEDQACYGPRFSAFQDVLQLRKPLVPENRLALRAGELERGQAQDASRQQVEPAAHFLAQQIADGGDHHESRRMQQAA